MKKLKFFLFIIFMIVIVAGFLIGILKILDNNIQRVNNKSIDKVTNSEPNVLDLLADRFDKENSNNSNLILNNEEKNTNVNDNDSSNDVSENYSSGVINEGKDSHNYIEYDDAPWLKSGVTEDEYYTKPVYPWARIDFDVKECQSIELCEKLCMEKAITIADSNDVSCMQVYTYSGHYLGEMLRVK